jgi:hypothetical protein
VEIIKGSGASPIEAALLPFRLRMYSLILSSSTVYPDGGEGDAVERLEEVVMEHAREGFRSGPSTSLLA